MAAHGLEESRATIARLKNHITPVGSRVFESFIPDHAEIPRDASGAVLAHVVVDFGAPVKTVKDRVLGKPELGQPHILPANIACIAADADTARAVMAAVVNRVVDWAPSATADAWELKGGYGGNRAATSNTPTRAISGVFLECTVNNG